MNEKGSKASIFAFISGRVQGVFFRMFTVKEAKALGLTGRVRNLPDGRVEVFAEGERDRLEKLIERLKVGPPGAVVENVQVDWGEYQHEYDDFQIDYR
ncbi:acylphosphatase [candidate division WOR-3 bacterium]|nr:acylphosphatase [candidate division WOR-3 bacterium]